MNFQRYAAQAWSRDDLDRLTEEEEAVLTMRRRGMTVYQAGDALGLSEHSIHRRETSIMNKLG